MSGLFEIDALPIAVTIDRQIAAVDRELRLRRNLYPRKVLAGQLSQAKATEEIELMEAVRATLVRVRGAEARAENAA